ncbi:MAG: pitrilysin family protein [Candidatus Aminicenantes bacterium]
MIKAGKVCFGLVLWAVLSFSGNADTGTRSEKNTLAKVQLSSGMPLIYQQDTSSRITVLQFSIAGGQFAEPPDKSGLSYLSTRMTLVLPDRSKTQTIMGQATQLLMTGRADYSLVSIACLSDNLEDSLKVVSEIMRNPLLSGIRINHAKEQMGRQIKSLRDDSENTAHQTAVELLFPGTGYARSIYGTEDSIKSIKKKDIRKFFDSHFRPGNMTAMVCSDLDMETVVRLLDEHFNKFPSGSPPARSEFYLPEIHSRTKTIERSTRQTLVGMAYRLPPLNARRYAGAFLLEHVLGKGIGSKLWPLRDEKKLAYHVNARMEYFREGGVMEVYLETESGKKEAAEAELEAVMNKIYSEGVGKEEWESILNYALASFLRSNETKQQRVQTISFFEMTGLGSSFFHGILKEMKNISWEAFNMFLRNVLNPENRVSILIGPGVSK